MYADVRMMIFQEKLDRMAVPRWQPPERLGKIDERKMPWSTWEVQSAVGTGSNAKIEGRSVINASTNRNFIFKTNQLMYGDAKSNQIVDVGRLNEVRQCGQCRMVRVEGI